jgi:hypothetical protein
MYTVPCTLTYQEKNASSPNLSFRFLFFIIPFVIPFILCSLLPRALPPRSTSSSSPSLSTSMLSSHAFPFPFALALAFIYGLTQSMGLCGPGNSPKRLWILIYTWIWPYGRSPNSFPPFLPPFSPRSPGLNNDPKMSFVKGMTSP